MNKITRKYLNDLYHNKNLTLMMIGKKIGLSYNKTRNLIFFYNIPTKSKGYWFDSSKEKRDLVAKKRLKTIKEKYGKLVAWNKGLTKETDERVKDLSEQKKVWRSQHDISGKNSYRYGKFHTDEWKRKQSLRKDGTGIPGELFEYGFEFTSALKRQIRKRDGCECQLCDRSEAKCLKLFLRVLDIHHIDYNKLNNVVDNLISLCFECHLKTNYNRTYWITYFRIITSIRPWRKIGDEMWQTFEKYSLI